MEIEKTGDITIVSTDGLIPPVEHLCGNVILFLSVEDHAELERIASEGIAPLMALGFSQAMAGRIRKALRIRTYGTNSLVKRQRRGEGRKILDELYKNAQEK